MWSGCWVDVNWISSGCQVNGEWMSSGCQVDVKWISSGWWVDLNIDTGLFCSCYREQGWVKSDSLLFHNTIYILTQGCFGLVIRNKVESNPTHCCSIIQYIYWRRVVLVLLYGTRACQIWLGVILVLLYGTRASQIWLTVVPYYKTSGVEWMSSGCLVDVEWMSSGCWVVVKW